MLEIALPIVLLAGLVATVIVSRNVALGSAIVAAGFGVSGALLQFVGVRGADVTLGAAQAWLVATVLVLFVMALITRRRPSTRTNGPQAPRWPWIIAGASAALFLMSRALAPFAPSPLSSVGHLITRVSAEDNAKWVDASAKLVGEVPLDTWANVGGPLILLLTLAASMIAGVSVLLYGGVNEVAIAAGTPILAQHLLIVASPFALTPLVVAATKIRGTKRILPSYTYILGAVVLWATVTVLLTLGHITLQYVLLILTLWVAAFLIASPYIRGFTSLAVASLAMVWFPLGPISLTVLGAGLIVGVRAWLRPQSRVLGGTLVVSFGALAFLLFEFLRSSLTYSLGISALSFEGSGGGGAAGGVSAISFPTLPLFSDPGGTEEVTTTLLALTIFGVLGALYGFAAGTTDILKTAVRFAPVSLLCAFASAVAVLDFWAVGDGPGYGALKIAFACLIPVLVTTLPLAIVAVTPGGKDGAALRVGLVAVVILVLSLDTLLPRALMQLKPSLWPSTVGNPYWGPAEVKPTGSQPLTTNPISCAFLPQGSSAPSALPWGQTAYSCTRLLSGVAGMGTEAAVLTDWQLTEWLQDRSLWDSYHGYISMLHPEVKNRSVILMNTDKEVVGIDSINYLLERYPPSPSDS